ncbi:MAG: radical SAM protein [Nitrospirae bacterium]|nr:radical SAM protein [Nitrospirota bacterium]
MTSRKIAAKIESLLSRETGTVFKDPGGKVSLCIVYPNVYRVGMSNLGFQGMYTLLNERPDVVCERAFLPDEEDRGEYRRTGGAIVSLESRRPLSRFDIVAFSVSFENDYPNIPGILGMSGIPVRAEQRADVHPLLIMGGVCAFFNPEPVADFFDVCFVGEAEETIAQFIDAYRESKDRKDLFGRAANIEGVYVPRLYSIRYGGEGRVLKRKASAGAPETVRRSFVKEIAGSRFRPSIVTPETEFSRMYLAEAMRGCPWSCRFCVAGYVYKPVRRKGAGELEEEIRAAASLSGRVGLIAPSLTDYPYTKDVLCIDGVDFSITSLRASPKSAELIRFLRGHKSVSIAPEAGTERLRVVIDKRITEGNILQTAKLILSGGVETVRLYFMVGLPTEQDEDVEGIVTLVKKIRGLSSKGNIVLTLSTFVPKPFTPFQWHPMERMGVVKERLGLVKKGLSRIKGVKVFHDVPKYAYMQGLFSRGDRRVSRVLEHMPDTEDWRKACDAAGVDPDPYLFRQRDLRDLLPWDFIDNGVPKEKLWAEYQKALGRNAS